jgi:hypothetical protein
MSSKYRLLLFAGLLVATLLVPMNHCVAKELKHKNFSFINQPIFPNRPERILNFPAYTVGQIIIKSNDNLGASHEKVKLQGAARGKIIVPAGEIVTLVASQRLFQEPQIINTLPADGIDCLRFSVTSLADSEDELCDRALAFIGHLKGLSELNLDRSDATDVGVAHVAELPNLQSLSIFSANCNGRAIKHISKAKKLRIFRLSYNSIKDEDLQTLGDLTQLQYLSLSRTGLSDAGMKYIAKCTNIEVLDVSKNPKIGDEGLKDLMTLKKLQTLNIAGTSISLASLLKTKKGPALEVLYLPNGAYSDDQIAALSKTFPGVQFCLPGKKHLDAEMDAVLSPLH